MYNICKRAFFSRFSKMAAEYKIMHNIKNQRFDYFLILDFEATCDSHKEVIPQEIIEFPVLKLNWRTMAIESEFHQYVQPKVNKELSPFCTELTGIIQDMVDGQPHLEETLDKFDQWMQKEVLQSKASFCFVTCGDWDLKTMLPSQCEYFNIPVKPYFHKWINIKKPFVEVTGIYPKSMLNMLTHLGIPLVGRHHSGIDDCRNIASILKKLLEKGFVFSNTGFLT